MAEMVPEIRLGGFTDPWEQRKLGEIAAIVTGSTPPTADADNYGGSFPFVSPADINESRFVGSTKTTLSERGFGLGRFVPARASLFVCIGSTVGKVGQVREGVVTNQQINAVIPGIELDADFTYSLLEHCSPRVKAQAGTQAVPIVNKASFADTDVAVPSLSEQVRIGSTLVQLDNLITLHQREHDKLVMAKTSFLQRLYPRDGDNKANLRFDGFSIVYERRQAKSIFREYDVRDHAGLPVLSAHQKLGMVPRSQIGYEIFHDEAQERTYKHIRPGQFVIHLRSFQGGFAHSAVEGIASPAYTVLEFCDDSRDYDLYWKHLFMSRRFIDSLRVVTYGIRDGRSISVPEFKELYFYTPSYEEQKAIGDFFEEMDKLIGLEAAELEKLKSAKSTLLRKMFV